MKKTYTISAALLGALGVAVIYLGPRGRLESRAAAGGEAPQAYAKAKTQPASLPAPKPVAAEETARNGADASLDKIPPLPAGDTLQPVQDTFGYDPQLAAKIYGRELHFVNFDPRQFPSDSELDRRSRAALGHFLSHTSADLAAPMWSRILLEKTVGDLQSQLRHQGFLPSPYRYQLQGSVDFKINEVSTKGITERTVTVPYSTSLGESVYRYKKDGAGDSGETYAMFNCLICHAGIYGNTVVGGAPNNRYNPEWFYSNQEKNGSIYLFAEAYKTSADAAAKLLVANDLLDSRNIPRSGQTFLAVTKESMRHGVNISDYFANVFRKVYNAEENATVGTQAATWMVFATYSQSLDGGKTFDEWESPEATWYEKSSGFQKYLSLFKKTETSNPIFALSHPRPWWLARYSGNSFWFGVTSDGPKESAGDLMLDQASGFHNNFHTPKSDERFEIQYNLQSYIRNIQSPEFPKTVDWAKAAKGATVYAAECAACHGRFELNGGGEVVPTSRFTLVYDQTKAETPFSKVGVDSLYWDHFTKVNYLGERMRRNGEAKKYGINDYGPRAELEPAIAAPPLVGLWVSAPYFHNGSVPTLWGVLDSHSRPGVWTLDEDPYAYDYEKVGVSFYEGPAKQPESASDWEKKLHGLYTYDTKLADHGMSNAGHTYGDKLSDAERAAVIEFLKIMDTRRVDPKVIKQDPTGVYNKP